MYCDVESKWKNYRIITFPGQALRNSYLNISVMELDHLLTHSSLTYPEVSSKVSRDSFCQLGNSVSLPRVIYCEAFYLHVVVVYCYYLKVNFLLTETKLRPRHGEAFLIRATEQNRQISTLFGHRAE